ncbi:MAG: nickel-dependent hydrogenase large subunit [Pontibacterium sp.]
MSRIVVGPFNRVEGDLEVTLDTQQDKVVRAQVNTPLYRGFEQILLGQKPLDALVYTPRICGICSVSQSAACAQALADLMRIDVPANGRIANNLILANENMTDLITHFYLFFMPDFARPVYANEPWFEWVEKRFKATQGTASRQFLPARAEFLHLMGLMAGKWPHTLSLQPGGTTKPIESQERMRLLSILGGFRQFLERVLFADDLDRIAGLSSVAELQAWQQEADWQKGDLRAFLHLSDQLGLDALGSASNQFLSFGNYIQPSGDKFIPSGVWQNGQLSALDTALIREDVTHSWMQASAALHPQEGETVPSLDKADAYSWCKSPRLGGDVVEVGALARQLAANHPLVVELVNRSGGNVMTRTLARLLELAIVIPEMQRWAKAIDVKGEFCAQGAIPDGEGVGLIEAARGALGHWIEVKKGKIHNYQIIAPTTWNFSPRDAQQQAGALEQALEGAPVRAGEKTPVSAQHIVRSFDPCLACTVH